MSYVVCERCHNVVPQAWCDVTGWDFEADHGTFRCSDGCRRARGIGELGLSSFLQARFQ